MKWLGVIVAALLALGSQSVSATVGVGGRPASPDPNNPRTESIFIHTVEPGTSVRDTLLVANNTEERQTIELYPVDGTTTNTGSFTCAQRADSQHDIGGWMQLDKTAVTLDPMTQTKVEFTIAAPSTAETGEHSGCIVIQRAPPESDGRQGMLLEVRSAVRVIATVPGDLKKDVVISALHETTQTGMQQYDVDLTNGGNVSADTKVTVRLVGAFNENVFQDEGEHPVTREGRLQLQYQNTRLPFWGGWYTLHADVQYDERPYVFGVDQGSGHLVTKTRSIGVYIWPHSSIFIIAALLVVVVTTWVVRRRLRPSREE